MPKQKTNEVKIAAKSLGALAMPDACPRCFWIKQKTKIPFQIFPGIFSSIDAYVKRVFHISFDLYGKAPKWLPELHDASGYLKVPHWSKFKRTHAETGITLSGVPDDIFELINGNLVIPDYKTAKFTETQDKLFPMYRAQLNAYAWIQAGLSTRDVDRCHLVYCEPVTYAPEGTAVKDNWPLNKHTIDGFDMAFAVKALRVDVNPKLIDELLGKAKTILDQPTPPEGLEDCDDCLKLNDLKDMMGWI